MNDDIYDYKKVIELTCTMTIDKFAQIGRELAVTHPSIFLLLAHKDDLHDKVLDVYKGLRDGDGCVLKPPAEHNENFVQAIRYYRNQTGQPLRVSKLTVEDIVGR